MVSHTAGAITAPMWFASRILRSTTRPSVPFATHTCAPSRRASSTAPAAVAVHCAEGGRCVPSSSGLRNCRSAVQKWLHAAAIAFSRYPPSTSMAPKMSASTNVEHAPYRPKKGVPNARAAKVEAMIWLFKSPLSSACTLATAIPPFWQHNSTVRRSISLSAISQLIWPSKSSSSTTSNLSPSGPCPSFGPAMEAAETMAGRVGNTSVLSAPIKSPSPQSSK